MLRHSIVAQSKADFTQMSFTVPQVGVLIYNVEIRTI